MTKIGDFIQHETRTRPRPIDRLRLILGGTLVVNSEIAVKEKVEVIYSQAQDHIEGGLVYFIKSLTPL